MVCGQACLAQLCATKPTGGSQQGNQPAGPGSWHSPSLQRRQGSMPAESCTCMPLGLHTLDSLVDSCQCARKLLLPSCAPAWLDTCCTANKFASGSPLWCCEESCPELHCARRPTLPILGADCQQKQGAWQLSSWLRTLGSQCL